MNHGKLDPIDKKSLKVLIKRLDEASVPDSVLDKTIKIATWNIRNFSAKRKDISFHYIAEVLSRFEIIAIIELKEDTRGLERVMDILGPYWKVIYSDISMNQGGNRERMGYLYDGRVVEFTGLAAEADPILTPNKKKTEYKPTLRWWRSPYMASFRAGAFDFVLLSAHIRWGKGGSTKRGKEKRRQVLVNLADWVEKRRKSTHVKDKDIILLGDFNIPKIGDPLYKAITKHGMETHPKILGSHGTNLGKNKRYDQILYYKNNARNIVDAGVVDFYHEDFKPLYPKFPKMRKSKFTYEMSDHYPMWIQLDVRQN